MNAEEDRLEVSATLRFVDPVESWFESIWTDTESVRLGVYPWRETSFDLTIQSREKL
jgi:hypothetical protein